MLRLSKNQFYDNGRLIYSFNKSNAFLRKRATIKHESIHLNVWASGGRRQHVQRMMKNKYTFKQLGYTINYLHATNSALAVFYPEIEVVNTDKEHEDVETTSIQNQSLDTKFFSMNQSIPSSGKVEFIPFNVVQHYTSDRIRGQYEQVNSALNNTFLRSNQLLLIETLRQSLPKNVTVEAFRRPVYDFNNSQVASYDVKISNANFLNGGWSNYNFDNLTKEEEGSVKSNSSGSVLSEEQLLLLNKKARKIINDKQAFEVITVNRNVVEDNAEILDFMDKHDTNTVNLVKLANHVEIMLPTDTVIPNTGFIKNFAITSMIQISEASDNSAIFRIQGIGTTTLQDPEVFKIFEQVARKFVVDDLLDTLDMCQSKEYNNINTKLLQNDKIGVSFDPLYKSIENSIKLTTVGGIKTFKNFLNPNNLVKFDEIEGKNIKQVNIKFEPENLQAVLPKEYNSPAKILTKNYKNEGYVKSQDQKKFYFLPLNARHELGLGHVRESDPENEAVKRAQDYDNSLSIVKMIGGPVNRDKNWYQRLYLHPGAMGQWSHY